MSILGALYHWGLRIDRRLQRARRLPGASVISVGNIAAGGRAKTPLVIHLCRGLKERGYEPVVLTRGYGARGGVAIGPGSSDGVAIEASGDEPREIAVKASVRVLVGADRARNALRFLRERGRAAVTAPGAAPIVFVLDDGFQHWALERDLDIVVVAPGDFEDRLLPVGRLREPATALQRADVVFELGRNLRKVPRLAFDPSRLPSELGIASLAQSGLRVVSARVPEPAHESWLRECLPFATFSHLADHAPRRALERALEAATEGALLVGGKEAVKIFESGAELERFFERGWGRVQLGPRTFAVLHLDLALEIDEEPALWDRITRRLAPAASARGA